MNLSQVIVITGITVYFLMKKQLKEKYTKDYVKSIRATLIVPILQIIFFTMFYEGGADAAKEAGKIDNLHNISTYTPYLGNLGTIADIANQNGLLPDIERSKNTLEFISAAGMASNIVSIGILIVIALALAELYGVYQPGKFTKKQMLMFYGGISATFLICSIYLGIWMKKLMVALSSVITNTNYTEVASFIFPITALLFTGIPYIFYSKALERLYSNQLENKSNNE